MRRTKLILLVDDDPDIARFIESVLRRQGYEVVVATNGRLGIDRTRELRPDLVISNVMMSHFDGFEMTRRIRSDEAIGGTPVLMLTAREQARDKLEGLVAGADDCLTKPFDPEDLIRHVKATLERVGEAGYSRPFEGDTSATEQDALAHLEGLT